MDKLIIDSLNKRLIGDKICVPLETIKGFFPDPSNNQVHIITTWGTITVSESIFTSEIQNAILDVMNPEILIQSNQQQSMNNNESDVQHRLIFRRYFKTGTQIEMCIQSKMKDGEYMDNFVQVFLYECALKISNNFRHFLKTGPKSNKIIEFFSGNEPQKMILNKKSGSLILIQITNKGTDLHHVSFEVSASDLIIDDKLFLD